MRAMIKQMIDNCLAGFISKLAAIQKAKAQLSEQGKEWARGVLLLQNTDHSPDETKAQYRLMMKKFHPDKNPELGHTYAQLINEAYKKLTNNI